LPDRFGKLCALLNVEIAERDQLDGSEDSP
jgi:hypothetical protein